MNTEGTEQAPDIRANQIAQISSQQVFETIQSGCTVITATRRLSRELVVQYDQQQLTLGKSAWQSADILPWDAWLERCWSNVQPLAGSSRFDTKPLLLSEHQLLAVWQQIIADDIAQNEADSQPLWHTRSSASAAVQALKLVRQWQIDADEIALSNHRDHRCFSRWYNQFDQLCTSRNWIDHYLLADLLRDSDLQETALMLTGFDRLLPQQLALIDCLQQQGVGVQQTDNTGRRADQINCLQFKDETSHWLAAASWAREKLQHNPSASLAIVPANPGRSRQLIDYCLKQVLCPEQIKRPDATTPLPFHISLGMPLSSYPPIQHALILLIAICRRQLSPEDLCRLIRSPFVAGASRERHARAQLELWARKVLPPAADFRFLLRHLGEYSQRLEDNPADSCSQLQQLLEQAADFIDRVPSTDLYANRATLFSELLQLLGWPGEPALDSREYQAVEAFRQQLRRLSELDLSEQSVSLGAALSALQHRLDQQVFQVEGNDAPVQVMGVLETAGLQFDHIWFGSLVEADWPGGTRPNPFVPVAIQRQAGVEQASVEASLDYAGLQQQRLLASCQTLTLGFHQFDSDITLEPSPLLAEYLPAKFTTPAVVAVLSAQINQAQPVLEQLENNIGSAVADTAQIRGGTSLIQAQAICPRGAYANFRLGAQIVEDNEPGLDAAERGSMVHHALEIAWSELRDSHRLMQLDEPALQSLLQKSVATASARYRASSGCGDAFFRRLQHWLVATLDEWFALEKQRTTAFTVLAVEQKTRLTLAGLPLDFKIDRIDRLQTGALVLIDYKTGSQNSINAWAEERISAPQLPLYTLSQLSANETIEAVAFAQVRLGNCALIGLADHGDFAPAECRQIRIKPAESSKPFSELFGDWQQSTKYWQYALENLAEEFLAGDARVAPGNDGVCPSCPTPAICRSGDRHGEDE